MTFFMDLNMADQFFLVGAIASLFSFALFFLLGKKQKSNNISKLVQIQRNESAKTVHDGECKPEMVGSPDIIIVGAGVAGSALACTLGKVISLLLNLHLISL